MRLVYFSVYSSAYSSAYSSVYSAPRDCPPLADTHFPPRGDGPLGRVGRGEGEETLLFLPAYPLIIILLIIFLTIDNTPFLYTYK